MVRSTIIGVLLLAALLVPATFVEAGGWASVRFDDEPGDVVAGEPQTFTMTVRQHDREAIDIDGLTIVATLEGSNEMLEVIAEPTETLGNYRVTITFPREGQWRLVAVPAPFPETEMIPLSVLPAGTVVADLTGGFSLAIGTGACLDSVVSIQPIDLFDIGGSAWGAIPVALDSLLENPHALVVVNAAGEQVGCGNLNDPVNADRTVVPIDASDSFPGGIAMFDATDTSTAITWFALPVASPRTIVQIDITAAEGGSFDPRLITIHPGDLVVWTNNTFDIHTIVSDSFAVTGAAVLDPGESFAHLFTESGTFPYVCGPHTWMAGTITVESQS
ncbi:MAG: hypothetical protein IT335_11745 [Thermomicrobiales bacterium]|nr:hypothetical protein [Thermomicrobiales bacterium]